MLRSHFPSLTRCVYLNTAAGGPIPDVVHQAATTYYHEAFEDGDIHWDRWMGRVDEARAQVGRLVGCHAESVGFAGNASVALNAAAALDPVGRFAAADTEFPSCTLPWLRRGFEWDAWAVSANGSFDADDVARALGRGARVVVLSSVQYRTGFRADLNAIRAVCRHHGARLVVDATQGIAAFPHRVEEGEVLVFSGYKWLTAGYGAAAMILPGGWSEGGSPVAGWRSQKNPYALVNDRLDPLPRAAAVEGGHPPFAATFAMGAAAALWNDYTPEKAAGGIVRLVKRLQAGVGQGRIALRSTTEEARLSGIVMLGVPDPDATAARLREDGILTSARGGALRVALHAYNTDEEVDRLLGALRASV